MQSTRSAHALLYPVLFAFFVKWAGDLEGRKGRGLRLPALAIEKSRKNGARPPAVGQTLLASHETVSHRKWLLQEFADELVFAVDQVVDRTVEDEAALFEHEEGGIGVGFAFG